jgi:hypothetical protein
VSDETQSTAAARVPDFSSPGQQTPSLTAHEAAAGAAQPGTAQHAASRPEVVLAGAFAAGFLFAKILRRRGD